MFRFRHGIGAPYKVEVYARKDLDLTASTTMLQFKAVLTQRVFHSNTVAVVEDLATLDATDMNPTCPRIVFYLEIQRGTQMIAACPGTRSP